MPELAKALCWCFVRDPDRLIARALASPLDQLASFLEFWTPRYWDLVRVIHSGILSNRVAITSLALETRFDQLAGFLRYAKDGLPAVHADIESALRSDGARLRLQARCLEIGPEAMVPLLRESASFVNVLGELDAVQWTGRWANARLRGPTWFRAFASACYKSDRGDLAAAIADGIILRGTRQDSRPSRPHSCRLVTYCVAGTDVAKWRCAHSFLDA